MGVFSKLLFLTFVLSPALMLGAPSAKTKVPPESSFNDDNGDLLALPPELQGKDPKAYLNISIGFSGGNYTERDQYQQGPVGLLRFTPIDDFRITKDFELQLGPKNLVQLGMGRRWYCCQNDEFNPFLRTSAYLVLNPDNELAGLVEIRRWRARAAIGLGERFTSEFGIGIAVTGPDFYAQFGFNIPL